MAKERFKSFKGGVHPYYNKDLASGKAIEQAPIPAEVVIPLNQQIGAPNSPLVSPGDKVTVGQKIGETDAFVSAPVHSSVAGTVKAVEDIPNFTGAKVKSVVITVDPQQPAFEAKPGKPLAELDANEIKKIAKEAGLVGMGGAAFPTHVKLSPPKDKPVDVVIINACECEPFLTCDHRLMLERPGDLVEGLKLLIRGVGADRGVIGIEANKMDAIEKVRAIVSKEPNIEVEILEVKYPEGSEKQLISAVTGRKVPPGKLPAEVGCLVQNVGTAIAMFEAASMGKPLYERVLTVTGHGIKNPKNFKALVGTPISVLIEAAGGFTGDATKLIMGGPMTGFAQEEATCNVVKGTSGILSLAPDLVDVREEHSCVRCTKCVEACPMYLMPNFIVDAVAKEEWEKAELWGALDCFECGCCSFTCPAYIPHVEYVRQAKARIAALKKR
ncbi:MAG TPA: electron transport complex subunit RsxC [Candidatus Anoxymicrobiaceae bacterium]